MKMKTSFLKSFKCTTPTAGQGRKIGKILLVFKKILFIMAVFCFVPGGPTGINMSIVDSYKSFMDRNSGKL